MLNSNGGHAMASLEKLLIFEEYYRELCMSISPSEEESDSFLSNVDRKKVSEKHRMIFNSSIQLREVYDVIQALKPNKAPALDGITNVL